LIVCVVGNTCFKSKKADEFAAIDTAPSRSISLSKTDAVVAEPVGLQITMLVITVVVEDGVVYRVVVDVDAAVRDSTLVVVAISYYLP
jgi:hypothetical protein